MADECLLSMGDTEGIDYTMKEYMKLVAKTQACVDRLNEEGKEMSLRRNSRKIYLYISYISMYLYIIIYFPQEAAGRPTRWSWQCGRTTWHATTSRRSWRTCPPGKHTIYYISLSLLLYMPLTYCIFYHVLLSYIYALTYCILYHVFLSFMPQYVVYFIIYYYHICPNKL